MTNYTINAMNDLYSTISFGGGGSSGSSGGTGHATLGPGGGSDPGNAGYPNPGLSSGPLTSTQSNLVTAGLIGLTTTPIGRVGQTAAGIGAAAMGWK